MSEVEEEVIKKEIKEYVLGQVGNILNGLLAL
jgi:hypothetical protein